jgi:hypothetical protein
MSRRADTRAGLSWAAHIEQPVTLEDRAMFLRIKDTVIEVKDEIVRPADADERNSRLRAVYAWIRNHPQHWNQKKWHCGTSHCVAGFGQLLGRDINGETEFDRYNETPLKLPSADAEHGWSLTVETDANEYFGLTESQGAELYDVSNTLEEIEDIIERICTRNYDPDSINL